MPRIEWSEIANVRLKEDPFDWRAGLSVDDQRLVERAEAHLELFKGAEYQANQYLLLVGRMARMLDQYKEGQNGG